VDSVAVVIVLLAIDKDWLEIVDATEKVGERL